MTTELIPSLKTAAFDPDSGAPVSHAIAWKTALRACVAGDGTFVSANYRPRVQSIAAVAA